MLLILFKKEWRLNTISLYDIYRVMKIKTKRSSRYASSLIWGITLFLFISASSASVNGQGVDLRFHRLTIEDGLSQNTVTCILQDKKGFMWFGTQNGLNRYDGHRFEIHKTNTGSADSASAIYLTSIYITSLCEDSSGNLWIGTENGLNQYDPEKEQFIHYYRNPQEQIGLNHNHIHCVYEDREGILWIGTEKGLNRFDPGKSQFLSFKQNLKGQDRVTSQKISSICEDDEGNIWIGTERGLFLLNRSTGTFTHYPQPPDDPSSISCDQITFIHKTHTGQLWIGTENGLNQYDAKEKKFWHYFHNPKDPSSLSHNFITYLCEDQKGNIWVGTKNGLNHLNTQTKKFQRYKNMPAHPACLSNNYIQAIYEDSLGIIWIGTYGGGINQLSPFTKQFRGYQADPNDPSSLSSNDALSFYEDREGILWVGTNGGGLNKLDPKTKKFELYKHDPNNPHSLSNDYVRSICDGGEGSLWIGTDGGGLNHFDPQKEIFIRYLNDPGNPHSISSNNIRDILKSESGILWIATNGGGLNKFDPETKQFDHYLYESGNPHSISTDYTYDLYQDKNKMIWIGTLGGGLNKFDPEKEIFTRFTSDASDPYSLNTDYAVSIHEDKTGVLWIGTLGGGLNKFDPENERFVHYTEEDGLSSNTIYGILEDEENNLWLSTNKGLSKFNKKTETFKNYDTSDGLLGNEFWGGSYYKSASGEMFFGTINGFNRFYPRQIKDNPYIPPVVITDFRISNHPVPVGEGPDGRLILEKSITETKEMRLSHKDRVVSFDFAALNYINPQKNEYAYIMEGFDKEWNHIGNRPFAVYSNLPPGKHMFKVKASNNDNVWNEKGVSLKITVTPPFRKTIWFQLVIMTAFIGLVLLAYVARTHTIRRQAKILQKKVNERTSELNKTNTELKKEIEIRQKAEKALKDRGEKLKSSLAEKEVLLKEIHHRVKNNMQIISSLLSLQASQIKDEKLIKMFSESQNRIKSMSLIHESLYKSGDLSQINFSEYIKNLTNILISSYGIDKDQVRMVQDIGDVFLDIHRSIPLGLIINELISNSLKHAFPDNRSGKIFIHMHTDSKGLHVLEIRDTGVGFPDNIDFRRTTSLGMQLVTGLVQQIQGTIKLVRDKGTAWIIEFPSSA